MFFLLRRGGLYSFKAQKQRRMHATIAGHSRRSLVSYCYPDYAVVVANPDSNPNRLGSRLPLSVVAVLASNVPFLFPADAPLMMSPPLLVASSLLVARSLVALQRRPAFPVDFSPAAPECPFHRAKARSIHAPYVAYASLASNHPQCRLKRQPMDNFYDHSQLATANQPLPPTNWANSTTMWRCHCCCHLRCCSFRQSWATIWQVALRKSSPSTWHCCMFSSPPV